MDSQSLGCAVCAKGVFCFCICFCFVLFCFLFFRFVLFCFSENEETRRMFHLILQLVKERGKRPPGAHMSPGIDGLKLSMFPEQRLR